MWVVSMSLHHLAAKRLIALKLEFLIQQTHHLTYSNYPAQLK